MRIKHATYKAPRYALVYCVICGENDSIQSLQRLDHLCLTFKLTNCILSGQRMFEPIVNHRKFQLRAILHERGFSICIDKYDIVRAAGNSEYVNYIVSIYCRHKSTRGKSSLYVACQIIFATLHIYISSERSTICYIICNTRISNRRSNKISLHIIRSIYLENKTLRNSDKLKIFILELIKN